MAARTTELTLLRKIDALEREIEVLRAELCESQDVLQAIREGQVDAVVVSSAEGDRVFTLEGAEHPYRVLIEQMQEGAATLGSDGTIYYANAAFAKILGRPLEDLLGSRFHEHVAPNSIAEFELLLLRSKSVSVRAQIDLLRSNDSLVPTYIGLTPVLTDADSSSCMVITDLTEQKRVEQLLASDEQARAILNQAGDGIVVCDLEGRLIFANAAAETFASEKPFSGQLVITNNIWGKAFGVDGTELPASEWPQSRALRGIASSSQELRFVRADGRSYDLLLNATPLLNRVGNLIGAVATFSDITERNHIEEALRKSEARFRSIFNSNVAGLAIWDAQGVLHEANDQFLKLIGYTRAQFQAGQARWDESTPPELCERDYDSVKELSSGREIEAYEKKFIRPDGTQVPVLIGGSMLPGHPDVGVAFAIDITERKQAEEALAAAHTQLQSIIDNTPDIVYAFDLQERFLMANDAVAKLFNSTPERMLGKRRQEFMPRDDAEWHEANDREVLKARRMLEFEECSQLQGRSITWLTKKFPLRDMEGRIYAVAGISADISERKRGEQLLKDADRKKDEFLAMLAHELRNPMAAISSAATLLSMANVAEEQCAYAKDVLKNRVKQLSRLVDDMLDVSRIIRGKTQLHKQEFDVCLAVEGAVEATKTFFEERKHTLTVEILDPLPIYGDPVRLEQVLNNFLTNAARYTNDGGRISLVARAEDGEAVISVKDDGIGISPALLPRIFDLFGQGDDSLHRTSGGLGIGLTLVKKLVELHGGSVTVISEGEGKGSEFIVKLPLGKKPPRTEPRHEERSNLPGLFILLAEDNKDTALLTAELLKQDKHDVDVAFDGPTALELGLQQQYDVILLDLGLPGMNGFDVAAKLRKQKTTNQPLIIAVSGYGQDHDLERATESGIDYHLLKPVDYSKLAKLLELRQGKGKRLLGALAQTTPAEPTID